MPAKPRRSLLVAVAASVLLLTGCPGAPTVKLEPITPPPSVVAQVDAELERTALALNGGTLLVSLVKAGTNERIPNSSLSLVGPTLGGLTNRLGNDVRFAPLIPGSYQLRVSAPGYKTLVEGNITLEANQELKRKIELTPEGGTVSGTVSANGQAVWGARVLLGDSWTFTGQDGSFSLSGVAAGAGTLKVRKGGYQGLDRAVTVNGATAAGELSLTATGGARTVALANGTEAFGGGVNTVSSELSSLMSALDAPGDGLDRASSFATANVRLVVSPKATLDAAANQSFVSQGGTLIVTGEWGGFGDYDPATVNALTRPFGLVVRPDLVRIAGQQTQREQISAAVNSALPSSRNVSSVSLHTGCSVMALPLATAIASSGANGYRVQAVSTGDQTLAAALPYGDGLVVVVGDTSAWVGSHLNEAGNRQFMLNLFGW